MYTVQGKDFVATDVTSITQLMDVASNQWIWVDIYDPNRKESEIILELLGNEPEFADQIEKRAIKPLSIHKGCVLCDYEKIHDCVCLTIPSIALEEQLRSYPIVLVKKKKMFITWGEEDGAHSKLIKLTIRRLRELVEEGEKPNSALAIGMLLRETAINNSDVLLSVRERIDQMEEQALENGGKQLVNSVFSFKKIISTLYRVMINEKDFMLDVDKSVIPRIKLDKKSKPIVDEAIEIIDRELDFMDSYTRTLDSILTLQDLASIHKVESSINYLTIVLVIGTAILIILELLVVLELL